MKTATFFSLVSFLFFAVLGMVSALPEPVQIGSILARDVDAVPASEGLAELVARDGKGHGDDDYHGKDDDYYGDDYDYGYGGDDYCWKKDGYSKCKDNSCCKHKQTCCGGKKCCDEGYKCVRKGGDYHDDDDKHKRGDDDHYGGKGHYEWYCQKKDDYGHKW